MRLLLAITGLACALSLSMAPAAFPSDQPQIAPPVTHDNLAVYFLTGRSAAGPVPLTLKEALEAGHAVVRETGNVRNLEISNAGDVPVFVQAGDIVKGGKQDRVITVSLLVPARSGPMPIGAFCVEQGRWSARSGERVDRFTSSENYLPSRRAKKALVAAAFPNAASGEQMPHGQRIETGQPVSGRRATVQGFAVAGAPLARRSGDGQSEVWASVAEVQSRLERKIGVQVASPKSKSSLQLSLENDALAKARSGYLSALAPKASDGDIIGVVFAINGRVSSAEVYPSNGLFKKMWPKLLEAAAIEAIGEARKPGDTQTADGKAQATGQNTDAITLPDRAAVAAFLADADRATANANRIHAKLSREQRTGTQALSVSTLAAGGTMVHRSYLAK